METTVRPLRGIGDRVLLQVAFGESEDLVLVLK